MDAEERCANCEGPLGSAGDPIQGWCWQCCHDLGGCDSAECQARFAERRTREEAEERQLEAMLRLDTPSA